MTKCIAVVGATGAQGGSVVRWLSQDGQFKVRALTRNPDSDKSKKLKSEFPNIELVRADLKDPASLQAAVNGVDGCFAMTFPDFSVGPDNMMDAEIAAGHNLADACKKAGVAHVIYSGTDPVMKEDVKNIPEVIVKIKIYEYMTSIGLPVSGVMVGFYYENILESKPQKIADNQFAFSIPTEGGKYRHASVSDVGKFVVHQFKNKDEYLGKFMGVTSEFLTIQDLADTLTKHLAPAKFIDSKVTFEAFATDPETTALAELFKRTRIDDSVEKTIQSEADKCHKIHPDMLTFDAWVIKNKDLLKADY